MELKSLKVIYDISDLNQQLHSRLTATLLTHRIVPHQSGVGWEEWRWLWYRSVMQSLDLVLFSDPWFRLPDTIDRTIFQTWTNHTEDLTSFVYHRFKVPPNLIPHEVETLVVTDYDLSLTYKLDHLHVRNPPYNRCGQ